MRLRTVVVGVALPAVVAAAAAGAVCAWLALTESGLRWIVAKAQDRAEGRLAIGTAAGTLSTRMTLTGIEVVLDEAAIEIDRLSFDLGLAELLGRRIEIDEIAAGNVSYRQLGPAAPAAGRAGPGSPFVIDIARASVEALRVVTPDTEIDFGPSRFTARLDGSRLTITELVTSTGGIALEADAEIGIGEELVAAAEFGWSFERDGVTWTGRGSADGSLAALRFRHRLESPLRMLAVGEARLGDAPRVEAVVQWEEWAWPGYPLVQSRSGRVEIGGWLDAAEIRGNGQLVIDGIDVEVGFAGSADAGRVTITDLTVASDYGGGAGRGALRLDPLEWDLVVDLTGLNPSPYLPAWPADASLRARLRGSLEPAPQWSLTDLAIGGTLRDRPLAASGTIAWTSTGAWRLGDLSVDWNGNHADLDGSIAETMDLRIGIDVPSIGVWWPGRAGRVTVDGALGGSPAAPSFSGRATAAALAVGKLAVDSIELSGTVSGIEGAEVDLEFRAERLHAGPELARVMTGGISGTTGAHDIYVETESVLGRGQLHAAGSLVEHRWTGLVDRLAFDQDRLGRWALERAVTATADRHSLSLERTCLTNAGSSLCLRAELGAATERLEIDLGSFELATLNFLIDERVTVAGNYDASLVLTGPFERPTGAFNLSGRSTLIRIAEAGSPLRIPIDRVEIEASLNAERFALAGGVSAGPDAAIEFSGTVADVWTPAPRIEASLDGRWTDLGFVSLLSPDIGQVSGAAFVSLSAGGRLDAPEVRGEARWTGGRIAVPRWGLIVDDVDVTVSSPTGRRLEYYMTAVAGDGRVEVEGATELDASASWPTRFSLRGDRLTAVQLPEAQIVVSPDLKIATAWPRIDVTGVITVPRADLRLDELPPQAVAISPDVVIHGREGAAAPRPLDVNADLRIVFGDDVGFSGSGLDAVLSGELDLDYRSGETAVATGTVFLDGRYVTLGQSLEVERGRLLFAGSLVDPAIDVRGVRRFESTGGEVVVGVLVSGTVTRPETRLFSEPAMSDGDIVSYLMVGRPLSDSSRENAEALQAAAVSMGLTQALPQIQHFGEAIGLDELGLRVSEANTGELMAGKQVSPRMYLRYTYGLVNRVGGLLLRFQLSDRLSLETRTGEYKAMDLLFTVERE